MAVPYQPEQFRHVINNLESSIAVAKRLRRTKSQYLDTGTKIEIDLAITSSEDVLQNIDRNIEGCRLDTQYRGLHHVKHHRDWLFRSCTPPGTNGLTPASCLRSLDMHIERMNAIQPPPPPITYTMNAPVPPILLPGYRDSLEPLTQGLQAPSLRKLRSRQSIFKTGAPTSMASTSTLSVVTEKEVDFSHNQRLDEDTSSSFSYDGRTISSSCTGDSSVSSDTSYMSTSCTESYCALEYCGNHGGAGAPDNDTAAPDAHSLYRDPGYSDKILVASGPLTVDSWNNTSLRAPSRRKKGRSGYI